MLDTPAENNAIDGGSTGKITPPPAPPKISFTYSRGWRRFVGLPRSLASDERICALSFTRLLGRGVLGTLANGSEILIFTHPPFMRCPVACDLGGIFLLSGVMEEEFEPGTLCSLGRKSSLLLSPMNAARCQALDGHR